MDKKLKLKQELEAKILEEENKKIMLEDQLNNFQIEEIKIIKRIQNTKEEEVEVLNTNENHTQSSAKKSLNTTPVKNGSTKK